jgi:hypothetical protein
MEEKIGRETLQKLLELQIQILAKYKEILDSDERGRAKTAVNNILKAMIAAVGPVFELQHLAYDRTVGLHELAVTKTGELLAKLLQEEQTRAEIHERMQEQARRGGGKQ